MKLLLPFQAIGWAAGVAGSEKSFVANPILGNERLNRWGLHRRRVALAARLAETRRAALARRIAPEDRAAFDRDGFVIRENHLPPETFARLRDEIFAAPLPAREMRQGQTVTRMIPLGDRMRRRLPTAVAAVRDPHLRALAGYVAGRGGEPMHFIQTVIAEPERKKVDPQTALHADTFHATAKFWLFLHDVGEEDGPFIYTPGSHRLTPERLAWEHEQSLTARSDARRHHALGSFRASPEDAERLGYRAPRRIAVPANTLVVADTYGFHSRAPSDHPTTRVELHGHLRRNPFLPWNGLDPQALPGISGNQIDLYMWWKDRGTRRTGKQHIWHDVGEVMADAPARI